MNYNECINIRFFKVTELPAIGEPDSVYWLLSAGRILQYVTDKIGNFVASPSISETITNLVKIANNISYTNEAGVTTTITLSPSAYSGDYNDLLNKLQNTSELTNNGNGVSRFAYFDEIPTNVTDLDLDFEYAKSMAFDGSIPYRINLKDQNGAILSFVEINPNNINGLSLYTGFDTRYRTKTEIANYFGGVTPITGYNKTNWDEAYSWGNHALAGYITSVDEEDPIFTTSPAGTIINQDIINWDKAFGWGDHALVGYLTSFTETDPIFTASSAASITASLIVDWNTAYGWGNHALAGYLTSYTETDPFFNASPAATITAWQITNWETAYGWGDHSTFGYFNTDQTIPQTVINGAPTFSKGLNTTITYFDTSYVSTELEPQGSLYWNSTDETLDLVRNGSTLQVGHELYARVRNTSGINISNGKVVYSLGHTGIFPDIALALSNSETTSNIIGITTEDINNNAFGSVTTYGYVRGLKTNYTGVGIWGTTWVEGDILYLSKTIAGQLTNIEPSIPHHSDKIAVVSVVHSSQGSILVGLDRHTRLENLSDVNGTALTTNGQILVWDNDNQYFDFTSNINNFVLKSGDTMTGDLIIDNGATQENLIIENGFISAKNNLNTWRTILGNSVTANNYLVGGSSVGSRVSLDTYLRIRSISDGDLTFQQNSLAHKVWHQGNDGSGSGLDADLLDGVQGSNYLLKSGGTMTGAITLGLGVTLNLAGAGDLWADSTNTYLRMKTGNLLIDDAGVATRFTFERTTGNFTATGTISATGGNLTGSLFVDGGTAPTSIRNTRDISGTNHNMAITVDGDGKGTLIATDGTNTSSLRFDPDGTDLLWLAQGQSAATVWHEGNMTPSNYVLKSGDTMTGSLVTPLLIANGNSGHNVRIYGSSTGVANVGYMSIYESNGSTRQGYMGFPSAGNSNMIMLNDASSQYIGLIGAGGSDGIIFYDGASTRALWHSGNHGAGSGLDADLLNGIAFNDILTYKTNLNASENLDNYLITGLYHQNSNADASSGTNYPSPYAGMLTVKEAENFIYQEYQEYQGFRNQWRRQKYSNSWSSWEKIWTSGNDGAGSGLDADLLGGVPYGNFFRTDRGTGGDANSYTLDGTSQGRPFSANHPPASHGRMLVFGKNYSGTSQIFVDDESGMAVRGQNYLGTWSSWAKVWSDLNDGAGSGLDADLLDGQHSSYYATASEVALKVTQTTESDSVNFSTTGIFGSTSGGTINMTIIKTGSLVFFRCSMTLLRASFVGSSGVVFAGNVYITNLLYPVLIPCAVSYNLTEGDIIYSSNALANSITNSIEFDANLMGEQGVTYNSKFVILTLSGTYMTS